MTQVKHDKNWHLHIDGTGVAKLIFDLAGEKINKFSTPVMQELDALLDELRLNKNIRVLVIESAKQGIYIAGADIAEIASITHPDDGVHKAAMGQAVFQKLHSLPFPTIAAIEGACLGGGLEFALACTYRIASDHAKTQLGLPEVSLGILPGFGGTQRLPRLIGLQRSLPLILQGKPVNAEKAYRLGVVDAFFAHQFWAEGVAQFVEKILKGEGARIAQRRKPKTILFWALEQNFLGQYLIFKKSRQAVSKQTKGMYPAPIKALDVIEQTYPGDLFKGLKLEARGFGELVCTDVCKHLISIFYANEALKKEEGAQTTVELMPIKRAAVLGAGVMGGGIAWLLSYKGIPCVMKDISWDAVAKGYQSAKKVYDQLIKIKKVKRKQVTVLMHRITGQLDYAQFLQQDLVVEAVVEDMAIKKNVLKDLELQISKDAIVATNTSALSVTEMATVLKKPSRFVGMHFFNPVNRMPLVEVIPGEKTSNATIASIVKLCKQLGKTPVVVKDCPGFLVNRILIPYMNEAAFMLQEGVDIEHVDRVVSRFGMPMGPFSLADEVGIDVGYKVAKILEEGYGLRMKVAPILKLLYEQAKFLGKKSGTGFYVYRGRDKQVNPELSSWVSRFQSESKLVSRTHWDDHELIDRLILMMVNEAAMCLSEGVVASAAYLDMAMILGTGFPPFRGGILRYADQKGLPYVLDRLHYLEQCYGPRFKPCDALIEMREHNQTFY